MNQEYRNPLVPETVRMPFLRSCLKNRHDSSEDLTTDYTNDTDTAERTYSGRGGAYALQNFISDIRAIIGSFAPPDYSRFLPLNFSQRRTLS